MLLRKGDCDHLCESGRRISTSPRISPCLPISRTQLTSSAILAGANSTRTTARCADAAASFPPSGVVSTASRTSAGSADTRIYTCDRWWSDTRHHGSYQDTDAGRGLFSVYYLLGSACYQGVGEGRQYLPFRKKLPFRAHRALPYGYHQPGELRTVSHLGGKTSTRRVTC